MNRSRISSWGSRVLRAFASSHARGTETWCDMMKTWMFLVFWIATDSLRLATGPDPSFHGEKSNLDYYLAEEANS
jgi:hypothetical protein